MLAVSAALQPAPAQTGAAAKPAAPAKPPVTLANFARLPFIEQPALSPDGRSIAGLFSVKGEQSVGVKSLFGDGGFIGFGVPDGVQARAIRWINDENLVVRVDALMPVETDLWYISRLLALNTRTRKPTRLLWDLRGQNASDIVWTPSDGSSEILVAGQGSIYLGSAFWPAVYRVDVATGKRSRAIGGREGINDWSADAGGNIRAGLAYTAASRTFRLLYRDAGDTGAFRTIVSADTRKREMVRMPFLYLPGNSHALVVHDDAQGRSGIYETDMLTQKDVRTVFVMPEGPAEVDYPLTSDDGTTLLGVATTAADERIRWIDPALAALQAEFDKAVPGSRAQIVSFSRDRQKLLVTVSRADTPGALYYYDVAGGTLQKVADMNPDLAGRRLGPVRLVRYHSRDGLDIEGVLTLPPGAEPHALPFIVMPHGGPWAQDTLRYDYWAQFLASRGYAVLQPNFRGSTGYGTEFLRRGEGQMGLAMQDDITDGVRWAVKEGIADESRVCIVGASYGGYAAMWGIAKDPALYRCAISIAGVASLRREVNDFGNALLGGKYRDDWTRMTPSFDAVSPFKAVDRIKAPLLLIHGKKDVTVAASQSARMFGRMKEAGKTVEYVPLPLADHYFTREQDRVALLTAMAGFLDRHNPAGKR